ncbi:hypothetical protein PanWU01x14_127750 [Parasponia andersonii]|uniref:Uncharacterized protein n=1 Tax=Parasponia andersonii TaxID=3476 RepID=A0A2P5CSH8_PARAD|nr:hypothetical protein PanWU01x14_127750 [Parasponia andersonii]
MGGIFSEKSDVFILEMGLDLLYQALADTSSCSLEVMRCMPVGASLCAGSCHGQTNHAGCSFNAKQ